jgi:hypothetical protein
MPRHCKYIAFLMVPLLSRVMTELCSFSSIRGLALLLHPEDARITVFANGISVADESRCRSCTIWYSQFTYAGDQVYESEITLHDGDSLYDTFQSLNNPFVPANGLGLFSISVANCQTPLVESRWLQFDERLKKFTEPRPFVDKGQMWADCTLFWWKDTFFSSLQSHDHLPEGTVSSLTHLGTSEKAQSECLMFERWGFIYGSRNIPTPDAVLLSDRYVVRVFEQCLYILCYEEYAHYPKEGVDFFGLGHMELLDVQKLRHAP